MQDIQLHDIKPIIDINDYSLYYLLGIGFIVILIMIGVSFIFYRYLKYKNRFDIRKEHYKFLNNINLDDAKKTAYDITRYGLTFQDDSLRHKKAYEELIERLEKYKYKRNVGSLDDDTIHFIDLYIGMIDV